MTDTLDQPVDDTGVSTQPSGGTDDAGIEAIVNRAISTALAETVDKRFKGFQSLIDRKFGELSSTVEQLKTAGLTPEEQAQLESNGREQEIERLRNENLVLSLRKDHPEAVDFFMEAMSQESLEKQIAFIESRLGKAAAAEVLEAVGEAAAGGTSVSVTDANNPQRKQKAIGPNVAAGQEMTDEVADALLSDQPKGALFHLRRQRQA